MNIKFISYTGDYPNLCGGVLTLDIDGKEYRFGHEWFPFGSWKTDGNYDQFWSSGGCCGFNDDYSESYVSQGGWIVNKMDLPEFLQDYEDELANIMNENISYGCCGGCL